ncbi:MAG: hypothetical protein V1735_02125 [Nanoarchaeota archaeon]
MKPAKKEAIPEHRFYVLLAAYAILAAVVFFFAMDAAGQKVFCTSDKGMFDCFSCSTRCDDVCKDAFCLGLDPDCLPDGSPLRSCTTRSCLAGSFQGSCVTSAQMLVFEGPQQRIVDCCTGAYCRDDGQFATCLDPDDDEATCQHFSDEPYSFRWRGLGGVSDCCGDDTDELQCQKI